MILEGGLRTKGIYKTSNDYEYLISVITVVFNGIAHLEKTILSVLNQTYSNIEYIIIDGRSTDGSVDLIKKYEYKIDYWISKEDNGIYDAMNRGIELVNDPNSYIIFLNSDDFFFNESVIKNSIKLFKDFEFIYGKVLFRDLENGYEKIAGKSISFKSLPFSMIQHQATFTKKSLFLILGNFNTSNKIISDYEFAVKVFSSKCQTKFINEIISVMAMGGMSYKLANITLKEKVLVLSKYYSGLIFILAKFKIKYIEKNRLNLQIVLKKASLLNNWRKFKLFLGK